MKIETNELCCSEEFVNVMMPNRYKLTTDRVANKPINNEKGIQIGKLMNADEDYIYGIVYLISELFKDSKTATCEINLEAKEN